MKRSEYNCNHGLMQLKKAANDMAPDIVAAINRQKDAEEIWNRVYDELVEPCVRMIHNGQDEEAYRLYKAYTLSLTNAMGE